MVDFPSFEIFSMTENKKALQVYSKEIANKALLEARNTQKAISYLLMEHASEHRSWGYGINDLLCEYYASIKYFITLLVEVTSLGSVYDEDRDEEVYEIPLKYYVLMKTYTKLMMKCEQELKYSYGISTMIH